MQKKKRFQNHCKITKTIGDVPVRAKARSTFLEKKKQMKKTNRFHEVTNKNEVWENDLIIQLILVGLCAKESIKSRLIALKKKMQVSTIIWSYFSMQNFLFSSINKNFIPSMDQYEIWYKKWFYGAISIHTDSTFQPHYS